LVYLSTLKMEAICFSEMLGCLRTAWHYSPEDPTLHCTCIFLFFFPS
jgi:hypothetical protein